MATFSHDKSDATGPQDAGAAILCRWHNLQPESAQWKLEAGLYPFLIYKASSAVNHVSAHFYGVKTLIIMNN